MKQAMIDYVQKPKNDDLYTPVEAITPLLRHLPKEKLIIWECCDFGGSKITQLLKEKGYDVVSTDIIHGFNFLTDTPNFEFDMIITNPPYSLKDDFLHKCYEYNKPFALLLPLTALEGQRRGNMFREKGISTIVLDKRINFTSKKNVWFNTSWFCYGFIDNNKLIFEKVNT